MGIVDNLKDIASLVQQADNLDLYRKALDAQKEAMDLVDENRRLRDEKRALKEQIREFTERLRITDQLTFDGSVYWQWTGAEDPGPWDGPFCPLCWDVDARLVRLQSNPNTWRCGQHEKPFEKRSRITTLGQPILAKR